MDMQTKKNNETMDKEKKDMIENHLRLRQIHENGMSENRNRKLKEKYDEL